MILILGDHDDVVVCDVERELRARGASSVRLASTSFPGDVVVEARWSSRGPSRRIARVGGETIDLDAIGAVYHRHMRAGRPAAIADRRARAFAELEGEAVLLQLFSQLRAPFVPAPWATIRAGQA